MGTDERLERLERVKAEVGGEKNAGRMGAGLKEPEVEWPHVRAGYSGERWGSRSSGVHRRLWPHGAGWRLRIGQCLLL